jgi:hypothetical protein
MVLFLDQPDDSIPMKSTYYGELYLTLFLLTLSLIGLDILFFSALASIIFMRLARRKEL